MVEHYPPITPGEYLKHEFLEPFEISQNKLAKDINVPVSRINEIIKGTRHITVDTALRLAKYFQTSPEMWINLQTSYDIRVAKRNLSGFIEASVRPFSMLKKNIA
jgi:addiction module HigA family antidote